MKRLIVFDLDGTLAQSKSPLDAEMAELITSFFRIVKVAVISGGAWPQFQKQVLAKFPPRAQLKRVSILPTCGSPNCGSTNLAIRAESSDWELRWNRKRSMNFATRSLRQPDPVLRWPACDERYGRNGQASLLFRRCHDFIEGTSA